MGEAGLAPPMQQTEPGCKRSKHPGSFDRQNEKVKRISPMKGGCGRGQGCADTLPSLDTRADTLNSGSSLIAHGGRGGSSHRERNKNQNNSFQTIPFYSMYSARGRRTARDNGDTGTTHTARQTLHSAEPERPAALGQAGGEPTAGSEPAPALLGDLPCLEGWNRPAGIRFEWLLTPGDQPLAAAPGLCSSTMLPVGQGAVLTAHQQGQLRGRARTSSANGAWQSTNSPTATAYIHGVGGFTAHTPRLPPAQRQGDAPSHIRPTAPCSHLPRPSQLRNPKLKTHQMNWSLARPRQRPLQQPGRDAGAATGCFPSPEQTHPPSAQTGQPPEETQLHPALEELPVPPAPRAVPRAGLARPRQCSHACTATYANVGGPRSVQGGMATQPVNPAGGAGGRTLTGLRGRAHPRALFVTNWG